jgi:hypothetical protein
MCFNPSLERRVPSPNRYFTSIHAERTGAITDTYVTFVFEKQNPE